MSSSGAGLRALLGLDFGFRRVLHCPKECKLPYWAGRMGLLQDLEGYLYIYRYVYIYTVHKSGSRTSPIDLHVLRYLHNPSLDERCLSF